MSVKSLKLVEEFHPDTECEVAPPVPLRPPPGKAPPASLRPAQPASTSAKPMADAAQGEWLRSLVLAIVLPAITFGVVILAWQMVQQHLVPAFPTPHAVWDRALEIFADPFYDKGPNDVGIGWQILNSLTRVMAGFGLALLVGVPVGFLMGRSETCRLAWHPLIQILRPVSPLAWLPIGLLLFQAVDPSAIFVIFITSIWPMIINTAAGVRAIPKDYLNIAAVLRLSPLETARRILLPAALPHVMTGMRLSLGIAWMVIVAAEMLTGGIGIGFFVWDEWNNLSLPSIIVAILVIGVVGILLEAAMSALQRRVDYSQS